MQAATSVPQGRVSKTVTRCSTGQEIVTAHRRGPFLQITFN